MTNTHNILVRKPKMKRTLRVTRYRWEDNIGIDLWEIQWEDVDWMHLAQNRDQWLALVNTIMNLQVP
jgi:hypothetical protein